MEIQRHILVLYKNVCCRYSLEPYHKGTSFDHLLYLSPLGENLSSGFPTRLDINQAVQPRKMAIGLKFWILEVEGLYYLCSEKQ